MTGTPLRRHSVWRSVVGYSVAAALPRAMSLALLPVLTRFLAPAEYGQVSIALSITTFATILFALGLDMILIRSLFQLAATPPRRAAFVASVWTFLMTVPLAGAAVLGLLAFVVMPGDGLVTPTYVLVSLVGAALFVAATTVPLAVLRADERLGDYIKLSGATALMNGAFVLVGVVVLKGGVLGWLGAITLANSLATALAMRMVPYRMPRPFDPAAVRGALISSVPVLPHFLSMWAVQLADRIVVAALLTAAATGVYSLAASFAVPMLVATMGIGQAFLPAYARAGVEGSPMQSPQLRGTILQQVTLVALAFLVCASLAPSAVAMVVDDRYESAAQLCPWLVLAFAFNGLYGIPMSGLTMTHGQTREVALVSALAAIVNVGLVFAVARPYGLTAVAIASAVGYAVLLAAVLLLASWKGAGLPYPWREVGTIIAITGTAYGLMSLTTSYSGALDLMLRVAWVGAGAAALAAVLRRLGERPPGSIPDVLHAG